MNRNAFVVLLVTCAFFTFGVFGAPYVDSGWNSDQNYETYPDDNIEVSQGNQDFGPYVTDTFGSSQNYQNLDEGTSFVDTHYGAESAYDYQSPYMAQSPDVPAPLYGSELSDVAETPYGFDPYYVPESADFAESSPSDAELSDVAETPHGSDTYYESADVAESSPSDAELSDVAETPHGSDTYYESADVAESSPSDAELSDVAETPYGFDPYYVPESADIAESSPSDAELSDVAETSYGFDPYYVPESSDVAESSPSDAELSDVAESPYDPAAPQDDRVYDPFADDNVVAPQDDRDYDTYPDDSIGEGYDEEHFCGFNEEGNENEFTERGHRFQNKNVKFRISKYSDKFAAFDVEDILARAFATWGAVTDLTFTRKGPHDLVDIDIRFETGHHGCDKPFDGPGRILAHAAMPYAHFDDSENWSKGVGNGQTNLYAVAVHELGHSLGLGHSKDENAIMYAVYNSSSATMKLNRDDIQGIQKLYGPKTTSMNPGHGYPNLPPYKPSRPPTDIPVYPVNPFLPGQPNFPVPPIFGIPYQPAGCPKARPTCPNSRYSCPYSGNYNSENDYESSPFVVEPPYEPALHYVDEFDSYYNPLPPYNYPYYGPQPPHNPFWPNY